LDGGLERTGMMLVMVMRRMLMVRVRMMMAMLYCVASILALCRNGVVYTPWHLVKLHRQLMIFFSDYVVTVLLKETLIHLINKLLIRYFKLIRMPIKVNLDHYERPSKAP
jgi:hypothetical protein